MQRSLRYLLPLWLFSLSAHADTPPPDALGKLFFSPSERAELDRIRAGIMDSDDPARAARTLRLDGMVQKNDQQPIIWVNGLRHKGHDIAGASITPTKLSASTLEVSLPPPDARAMYLKVGQTLDPAGGNLREVYQRPPQELNQLLQLLSRRGAAAKASATKAVSTPPQKPPAR
ncbi:hypothetical protein [Chitinimonas sp. BJYL2]|uniref:hypothetical protein n=1 Tax=Chitinimonas sp. BJYL2 TaxID=2976696 RepID=UPI0022B5635B|nr:hypothetical protein [Chitinimonas sp. BJYL2]